MWTLQRVSQVCFSFLLLCLGLCLLNSIECHDSICKGLYLTLGELYKCNNVAQLLFNFEGFLLDNTVHNVQFKLNYPLLFPKFTIKLSIKTGSDSSSNLSKEALYCLRTWVCAARRGAADRQVTDRQTDTPSPVILGCSLWEFSLSQGASCNQEYVVSVCSFNSQRSPQFVTPIPGCKNWSLTGSPPQGTNLSF